MCVLGYNCDSFIFPIKRLNNFEFGKSLIKIREAYCESYEIKELFSNIIEKYDLTKKEIRTILEETEEYNEDFLPKLNRSINNNKKDNSNALSRKLAKICNRESTENSKKQKAVKIEHIYNLLLENNLDKICNKLPRIVMFIDNPKAHKTDLVRDIAKILNIYLLDLPPYSPEFAPVETIFLIIKREFRKYILETKGDIIDFCLNIFNTKCKSESIYKWFIERYLTIIC